MKGQVTVDHPVAASTSVVWEVYSRLEFSKLVNELLAETLGTFEILEGDGEVGTVLKLTFPPGTPEPSYLKEKFIRIDDENRIKETEIFEGAYKALGFDFIGAKLEILESESSESSIVRSSIVYEGDDKLSDMVPMISTKPLDLIAEIFVKYLNVSRVGATSN
ncbi:hypothetical protein ACFE04_025285 [Oxalis oulophora]